MQKHVRKNLFTLFVVPIFIILLSSCGADSNEKKASHLKDVTINSKVLECPYKSVILVSCSDFPSDTPIISDQISVNKIYSLMQPSKWTLLKDDPGNHMGKVILNFDDSEYDVYSYGVYSDGTIFFVHSIKNAKAVKIPNGTFVQGDYTFYKAPDTIYNTLVSYLKPKYEKAP